MARGRPANEASGDYAVVVGGADNAASGDTAAVCGGAANVASGRFAAVAGGHRNLATSQGASVAGGADNRATGRGATVAGGSGNVAGGELSTVGGGHQRSTVGQYDWRAGTLFQTQSSASPARGDGGPRGDAHVAIDAARDRDPADGFSSVATQSQHLARGQRRGSHRTTWRGEHEIHTLARRWGGTRGHRRVFVAV